MEVETHRVPASVYTHINMFVCVLFTFKYYTPAYLHSRILCLQLHYRKLWLRCRHISGAAGLGLTQIQLADKLMHGEETCSDVNNVVQALLDAGRLQWAPAFDEELLVAVDTLSKLKPEYQPSLPEDAQPAQDFHSLAGLQAASSRRKQLDKLDGQQATDSNDAAALDASKGQQSVADGPEGAESAQQMENNQVPHIDSTQFEALPSDMQQQQLGGREKQSGAESLSQILLKPWTDHKGALNEPYWAALTQRVMSVIMRNPGEHQLHRAMHQPAWAHPKAHMACISIKDASCLYCDINAYEVDVPTATFLALQYPLSKFW